MYACLWSPCSPLRWRTGRIKTRTPHQRIVPRPRVFRKDVVTRAKLHTELGALYFQSGNLIVALEERTIATSINLTMRRRIAHVAWCCTTSRNLHQPKAISSALEIAENDPEINNNYGWFLCQTGKERESLPYFDKAMKNPCTRRQPWLT